jgi:hypothetical protein
MKTENSTRRALIRKVALACFSVCAAQAASAADVTIATFNSPAMLELKKLSASFEKANPDIELNWVILEENVLRQRATTDITTNSGQFDVVAIGTYEAPLWGKRGWLSPMTDLPAEYDLDDVVKTARDGLSYDEAARNKPHPDVYLEAAAMGVSISRCAVVEDSVSGVTAGATAGATVFAYLPDTQDHKTAEALRQAGAVTVFSDMPVYRRVKGAYGI